MATRRWNRHEIEAVGNLAETAAEIARQIERFSTAVAGTTAAIAKRGRGPRAQAWIERETERIADMGFQLYSDATRLSDDARAVRNLALESAGSTQRKDETEWLRRQLEDLGRSQELPE